MGDTDGITSTSAKDAALRAAMKTANMPGTCITEAAAADSEASREASSDTDAPTSTRSSAAPAAEGEAVLPPPRLLDSDPSKFRSLKRVIVIGRPGSGTDGISDALKTLGFKVYDVKTASDRYERDFPLWLEAARLRQEDRPYNKSDFDKLIGDHDAIVGAPACFFDLDFVRLYPNVRVILMTRDPDFETTQAVYKKIKSKFWQRFDPVYYGTLNQFYTLCAKEHNKSCTNNDDMIRSRVRERNLLEIHNLITWVPLCEFLGVKVPDAPAPELHDDTTKAELAARPQRAVLEKARKAGHRIVKGLRYIVTTASMNLMSVLVVLLGFIGLYQLLSAGLHIFRFLAVRSQIRDTTRLAVVSLAILTFICGMGAGYSIALMRIPRPIVVESPPGDDRRRNNNSRRNGGKGRDRQSEHNENRRPERPTLDEWTGVQESIRRDDVEKIQGGRTTFEEWKNGKHVTFHVTHKRTEGGQDLFSGPRKVLSVTEETIE